MILLQLAGLMLTKGLISTQDIIELIGTGR